VTVSTIRYPVGLYWWLWPFTRETAEQKSREKLPADATIVREGWVEEKWTCTYEIAYTTGDAA
jgi:hypothetical protein